jgi:hypothetical protein
MESISQKIIEKIKKENITPKPKWHFLLKNSVLWASFAVSIAIGSLAVSIILHLTHESDWDIYRYLEKGYGHFLIDTIPLLWIGFVLLFLAVAYYNCRHTDCGYRYQAYYIVFSSFILSFILGYGCYAFGLGRIMDEMLSENVNCYCGAVARQKQVWSQPDKGLLAGRVIEIKIDDNFDLEDFSGHIWQVRKNGEEIIYRNVVIRPHEQVKIIGRRGGETIFVAKEVRPWMQGKNIPQMQPGN